MLLDLSKVRTPREHYQKVYQPGRFAAGGEPFQVVAPAALEFELLKDKRHFRVIGTVKTTLEMPCSRCLDAFELPIDAQFDLRYQPHASNAGAEERQIEEDDLSTSFYDNDELNLGQLMLEQFYLSLPMKPLCRQDCQGLCTVCGTNLNRAACQCEREWVDPRFAALRALKKES